MKYIVREGRHSKLFFSKRSFLALGSMISESKLVACLLPPTCRERYPYQPVRCILCICASVSLRPSFKLYWSNLIPASTLNIALVKTIPCSRRKAEHRFCGSTCMSYYWLSNINQHFPWVIDMLYLLPFALAKYIMPPGVLHSANFTSVSFSDYTA